jgi:ABC-type transport system involved in multi-copper enzyme maturation permease subunit
MGAMAWLQFRQILAGRKVWLVVFLLALPVGLTGLIVSVGGWSDLPEEEIIQAVYLFILYPQSICLLLALLYGTSVLNEELEGKTVTYLFTRPLERWRILVGKYAAVVACLAIPALGSLGVSWWLMGSPGGASYILGFALAVLGALAAYTAIFTAFGVLFRTRTLVIGLLYAIMIEFVLSFVPAVVSSLSAAYYLRSVVVRVARLELPKELLPFVGESSLLGAALLLGAITAGGLGLASFVCRRREYVVTEQL